MKPKTVFLMFSKFNTKYRNSFLILFKNSIFRWALAFICVFNLVHTAYVLDHPFIGQNAWRDAQTFGAAQNYIREQTPFLQPSYYIRTSDDGRLPGEFPLQSYYCSLFMKMSAVDLFHARLSNYLLGLVTAILLFFIGKKLGGINVGLIIASIFVSNALTGGQMVAVMPETMGNLLAALVVFLYFYVGEKNSKWLLVILITNLCILVKPSGYVIVAFIILFDFLKNGFQPQTLIYYLLLLLVPVICLKSWMNYTMQFETSAFIYPITHHYVRTPLNAINDFGSEVFFSAIEKTMRHSFNVAGILGILLIAYYLLEKSFPTENKPWIWACLVWVSGGIAFLLYAGTVQTVQLYYATPLIIPAALISCQVFNFSNLSRFLFLIIILLQSNIKINTFNDNYLANKDEWESFRLEKITDTFSTAKNPFIVYPFPGPDFAMLGRMGRNGFNSESIEIFANKNKYFEYVCLVDSTKKADIAPFIENKLLAKYAGKEFYKLK